MSVLREPVVFVRYNNISLQGELGRLLKTNRTSPVTEFLNFHLIFPSSFSCSVKVFELYVIIFGFNICTILHLYLSVCSHDVDCMIYVMLSIGKHLVIYLVWNITYTAVDHNRISFYVNYVLTFQIRSFIWNNSLWKENIDVKVSKAVQSFSVCFCYYSLKKKKTRGWIQYLCICGIMGNQSVFEHSKWFLLHVLISCYPRAC